MNNEFSCPRLERAFNKAKEISEKKLNNLDKISDDIKKIEKFLQSSGFSAHEFCYEIGVTTDLGWDGSRLNLNGKPLIESKAAERLRVYPLLWDFLNMLAEENK